MNIPEISHLQYFTLKVLEGAAGFVPSAKVREALWEAGWDKTLPAFYQLTGRLEDMELIDIKNLAGREKAYRLSGAGVRAMKEVRAFYRVEVPFKNVTTERFEKKPMMKLGMRRG